MVREENHEPSYTFWRDGVEGEFKGGIFYRSVGLGAFIRMCEDKGYVMAGVRFDQSNNCEFIFKEPENGENNGE